VGIRVVMHLSVGDDRDVRARSLEGFKECPWRRGCNEDGGMTRGAIGRTDF
jgi:hypothetical protein